MIRVSLLVPRELAHIPVIGPHFSKEVGVGGEGKLVSFSTPGDTQTMEHLRSMDPKAASGRGHGGIFSLGTPTFQEGYMTGSPATKSRTGCELRV